MGDYRLLTPVELQELQTFAERKGRNWKKDLAHAWAQPGVTLAPADLFNLKHTHGPAWLKSFSFFNAARNYCRSLGFSLTKRDGGEFRLNIDGGTEEQAYYTSDLVDAMGTADAIHDGHQRNAKPALAVICADGGRGIVTVSDTHGREPEESWSYADLPAKQAWARKQAEQAADGRAKRLNAQWSVAYAEAEGR